MLKTHPVLTCKQAHDFEQLILEDDNQRVRAAMQAAGKGVANGIMRDYAELGSLPEKLSLLVIAGKGHNAGDALIAAETLLDSHPESTLDLLFALGKDKLRPNVSDALARLQSKHGTHIRVYAHEKDATKDDANKTLQRLTKSYDISIDGMFGMTFKPPFSDCLKALAQWFNDTALIHFRAAVDMPSGLSDHTDSHETPLRADATYATGIIKTPILQRKHLAHTGRIRYVDIGFFENEAPENNSGEFLLQDNLRSLNSLRRADSDKRNYGHLLICAGSRDMPGAVLMATHAALKSGVGLLTVCAPESVVPHIQGFAPEAMWLAMPETSEGGISSKGFDKLFAKAEQAHALLIGPGMGREEDTQAFLRQVVSQVPLPTVLDADALHSPITEALAKRPKDFPVALLTPHAGEFKRIAKPEETLLLFSQRLRACTLLKGSITELTDGKRRLYSTAGSPALARGGAGDILAGLAAGLLAQLPEQPLDALSLAQLWHAYTAEYLALTHGTRALRTTNLLDHLHRPLRNG